MILYLLTTQVFCGRQYKIRALLPFHRVHLKVTRFTQCHHVASFYKDRPYAVFIPNKHIFCHVIKLHGKPWTKIQTEAIDLSCRAKDMHFCFSFTRNKQCFLQAAQSQLGPHSQRKHDTQEFAWKRTTSWSRSRPSCFDFLWCSHEVSYIRMFTNCTKGVNEPEFNKKMLIADYYYADWQRNPAHVWAW